jgi:hypothetical protein
MKVKRFSYLREVTSNEVKTSIIYKLFPTIDTSYTDFIDSDKLKNFKTFGLKDKKSLMKCIEDIIWKYEKGVSNYTGVSEKDIKGNIYVYSLDSIIDDETVILNTGPRNNSTLSDKMTSSFFWDIRIIWDFCKKRLDLVCLNPSIHPL